MAVLELTINDGVAVLVLNRPHVLNALDPEAAVRLIDAFESIREDASVRVAILTAAGDRAFSTGGDLAATVPLMTGARAPQDEWDRRWLAVRGGGGPFKTDVGKPLIAAVNGDAIAGGMELVQNADLRIAVPGARFGVPEVQLGLFPGGASSVRLPRQLPYAVAMELLLTGGLMTAEEAYRLGFVNALVPREQLMDRAMTLARRIADNGPVAVQAVRASARACLGLPEPEALALESRFAEPVLSSADAVEGPKAFMEKRRPSFVGR